MEIDRNFSKLMAFSVLCIAVTAMVLAVASGPRFDYGAQCAKSCGAQGYRVSNEGNGYTCRCGAVP